MSVFNEAFPLLFFFNDKNNMFPCTKIYICTWLLDSGCILSDVWKYGVMISLLSVPDTDNACTVSNGQPIILPVSVLSTKACDTTHVHSNVVHTFIPNHIHLFAVK